MSDDSNLDNAALSRRSRPGRRVLVHTLGLVLAALLTLLIWWGYRQPAFLIDISGSMLLC